MRKLLMVPSLAVVLSMTACGGEAEIQTQPTGTGPAATAPADQEATFVGVEYEFQGPDSLAAGSQTVTLSNEGQEPHELQLALLEEGRSIADIEALFTADDADQGIPEWVTVVAHTFAEPGATGSVDAELEAGTYVLVCFVPAADGVPHGAKGMVKQITVA